MAGEIKHEDAQEAVVRLDMSALEAPMTAEEIAQLDNKSDDEGANDSEKAAESTEDAQAAQAAQAALEAGEQKEEKIEAAIEKAEATGVAESEIAELRGMLRELRQDNIRLQTLVDKHERIQNSDVNEQSDPSKLEALQTELTAATSRKTEFNQLIALMEVNPKYEDVNEVCSAQNFEDIFEIVAKYRAETNGTSFAEEYLGAKVEVWKMPNPYKYMYEVIKEHHPKYVQQAPKKEDVAGKSAKEVLAATRKQEPVKAPGTVANLGGGAPEQGGWTAARIDALPEVELHKVPKDVYQAYLKGELD